jgi:hypothetical protein
MMKTKKWITLFFLIPAILIGIVLGANLLVDPYSMTGYNVLEIPNKFARDDRVEKVAKLKTSAPYDNMMFGSSRVYSMNPLMVSRYLGGTTYNAGVGTARIEDHLGFLLMLKRIGKLPKNVLIGLDFYTFNPEVETNQYFLKNEDLNFLHAASANENYLSKFLSIDAFRASYKTLKNFLSDSREKPRFNEFGSKGNTQTEFGFYPKANDSNSTYSRPELIREYHFVKTVSFPALSQKRLEYLRRIKRVCRENNITLYLFTTPLHGGLIAKIDEDGALSRRLDRFKHEIRAIAPYHDFITRNPINDSAAYFSNPTHATTATGNLILARLFKDKTVNLPEAFGVYRPLDE